MEKTIDLHVHSTRSDGSMTPSEVVCHAKNSGLSAIALSDHDTVSGVSQALCEGAKIGLEVIPAIELSLSAKTETHMLGYFIDINNSALSDELAKSLVFRRERNSETCEMLHRLGFDISLDEVYAFAGCDIVGRAHFSKVMCAKGYVKTPKEAFDLYLANGKPAYSNTQYFTAENAIGLIHSAGGIAVCAHLHQMRLSDSDLFDYIKELKELGLDGVEGYYSEYTEEMGIKFRSLAKELGLILSGGSDFHAAMKPQIAIGKGYGNLCIPYSVLENMKAYRNEKYL